MQVPNVSTVIERWNLSDDAFENTMTVEKYAHILGHIRSQHIGKKNHLLPATFDPFVSPLPIFPQAGDETWNSLTELLTNFKCRKVLNRLPLFWQAEMLAHRAIHAAKAVPLLNHWKNAAVGVAAVLSIGIDAVITRVEDAEAFATALLQKKAPFPALWVLVYDLSKPGDALIPKMLTTEKITVAREVHLYPGVPVLVQCPLLAQKEAAEFHVPDAYTVAVSGESVCITSTADSPLPLINFELPARASDTTCVCGKKTLVRT